MPKDRQIVLVDIDGTLANNKHRAHWLDKEHHPNLTDDERWDVFFSTMSLDTIIYPVAAVVHALFKFDYRPIIVTGRPERYRELTRDWLNRYEIPFVGLYMRPDGDRREDSEVKEEMLGRIYRDLGISKSDILLVLDDRNSVVSMWRRLGLQTLQVAEGNF